MNTTWATYPADTLLAKIARTTAPGYSACLRCGMPWRYVEPHTTRYSRSQGCFPLCADCWTLLGSAENRLPFYRQLVLDIWCEDVLGAVWPQVLAAVIAEGSA